MELSIGIVPLASTSQEELPMRYSKIGGMHFFRLGSLQVSVCLTRKPSRLSRVTFSQVCAQHPNMIFGVLCAPIIVLVLALG
jgi:hypothetical protein